MNEASPDIQPQDSQKKATSRANFMGLLYLFFVILILSGFKIHHYTTLYEWEKWARFLALIIGAPAIAAVISLLILRFMHYIALLAILTLVFIVGLLIWINI